MLVEVVEVGEVISDEMLLDCFVYWGVGEQADG